jgi:hypothetical protein
MMSTDWSPWKPLSSFTLHKQLIEELSSHDAPPSPGLWERLRDCKRIKDPLAVGDTLAAIGAVEVAAPVFDL